MMVAKLCLGNGDGLYTKDLSNLDGHTPNLVFQTTSGES
jgi:hypothetical protein